MHFFLDLYIDLVYSILMIKERLKKIYQLKNEIFTEYNNCKTTQEKIDYLKSLRAVDTHNTLNIEYDNLITKLYSHEQSKQ